MTQPKNAPAIASSYAELQSLPQLMVAVRRPPVPSHGSELQARRALMQASELIMVNVTDLMRRVSLRIADGDDQRAVRLLEWLAATMKAWAVIAERIPEFSLESNELRDRRLSLRQSSNWKDFAFAEDHLAVLLSEWLFGDADKPNQSREAPEPAAVAAKRVLMRITMYERLVRENLSVSWPTDASYAEIVRPDEIRACVQARVVRDTVLMEFRTTHQVPEILTETINDHLEHALGLIRGSSALAALAMLKRVELLLDCSIRFLELLTENLRLDEYHAIREYLGLTSGSHSVGLAYHLMRDLYPGLGELLAGERPPGIRPDEWNALRSSAKSIGLRLDRWRLEHMNLPRTSLGESSVGTRSLIGSRDAVQTASKLRESAVRRDPLLRRTPQPYTTSWGTADYPLGQVESLILTEIAGTTQSRFADVQGRRGRFEAHPDFKPPPSRSSIATEYSQKESHDRDPSSGAGR